MAHQPNRWDSLTLALLAGLLAFMPFTFGAVEAWSEYVVVLGAAALSLCGALRLVWDREFRPPLTWAYLPLGLVMGLLVWQLVPLSSDLLGAISPRTVELRQELLGTSLATGADNRMPLSLYPYQTAHVLRLALVFCALFFTAASAFRSARQIQHVLTVVFVIGCLQAGLALLQILTFSTKIHWRFAEQGDIVTSGSFINYSNFSQFMNMSLGAGIALLLIRLQGPAHRAGPLRVRLTAMCGPQTTRLLAGVVLCAVAVLMSMSRNGAISLLLAAAVVGLLLYWRGALSTRGWLLGMAPLCVLGVLFLTCFDLVYERLATLKDPTDFKFRLEMTAGTLRAWRDFPWFGAGVGTHAVIFPLYDTAITTSLAEHADNDWAQLLAEFGLVGAGAVVAFLACIVWLLVRLMFGGRTPLAAAGFGISFGFIATAIHSFSDFGQRLPAVFSLTAVLSGLVVALAAQETRSPSRPCGTPGDSRRRLLAWRLGGTLALLGLGAVWWWAVAGASAAYEGEYWTRVADEIYEEGWPESDQDYTDLLTAAQYAAEAEPHNVRSGYWLNWYRWQSIIRDRDVEIGQVALPAEALPLVARIAAELTGVRASCPTYGRPYCLEGELRLKILGEPVGAKLIRQAAKLAPYHARNCLLVGQLEVEEGRMEEARDWLGRAVRLDPGQFGKVAQLYLALGRPELAVELATEDYRRLWQLAQLLESASVPDTGGGSGGDLAVRLRTMALARLRERADSGAATAGELARLAASEISEQRYAEGIGLYRRALARQYRQTSWRLELARALAAAGETDQAIHQARICLRLQPGWGSARKLIEELSLLPVNPPVN